MKKITKLSSFAVIALTLCATVIFGCRCTPKSSDPLAGFRIDALYTPNSNKAIEDDYKDYIQKLPPDEKKYARVNGYYIDNAGEHAVVVEVDLNGTAWYHALFYDKNNKRTKVTKYVGYHYMS